MNHLSGNALALLFYLIPVVAGAIDHAGLVTDSIIDGNLVITRGGETVPLVVDLNDEKGVLIAADNLAADFGRVTGNKAAVVNDVKSLDGNTAIIVGSLKSSFIKDLVKRKKIDAGMLDDKPEKYIITTVDDPLPGIGKALVVAGSDKRGAIYGIYELSEQIGVSPWYDWADVPTRHASDLSIKPGIYTAGSPAVKYRGIFLNDEAPCLTSWVKNTYGTDYGDHRFYGRVFELILRLRGNFLWPAMWSWAFYADDPENSRLADEMGVIIGTSHHEPMARNHQEYARHRSEYGKWDYQTNSKNLDKFFREGIERAKNTEDVITIGMRGDGDEAMGEDANVALLDKIIKNQRGIIKSVTGKKASDTPQVWALYKEVLDYYDKGLRAPDDVIYLLCDDNWGNVRRLPDSDERKHPGGWGMYYHVDYVGAPRNSKWINVTPIQNMWEQLQLTYDYGVDKLWVLNVGDLKPMEYPITLFLDMAWNPGKYDASTILDHTRKFCKEIFGENQADEAARILNLYSKYNGRVTAEMLDADTYNLASGEWKEVADEYARLEKDALRQYVTLPSEMHDSYRELILFPVQAMANLYDMYYAQAMNRSLVADNNPEANVWADRVKECFVRDSLLCAEYNNEMAGGKWKGMMTQKHIGYTSWNDNFPADKMPEIAYVDAEASGGYTALHSDGCVVIEAEHYNLSVDADSAKWTLHPGMGRTLSGVSLMPYSEPTEGASLTYKFTLPDTVNMVNVHVITKSTLAFKRTEGHRYTVAVDGQEPVVVNFNENLNESPENIYNVFYPTVARRVVEKIVEMNVSPTGDGVHQLTLTPIEPGTVFEKIVVDFGGYEPAYLFGTESKVVRQ